MSISFTPEQRKAITRRRLNITTENAAFATTGASFDDQAKKLLEVDNGNAGFYNFYDNQVKQYEAEGRAINGTISDAYLNSDIQAAAENPTIPPFFPVVLPVAYTRMIPLIQDGTFTNNKVKGWFYPTGLDASYEFNILQNANPALGILNLINLLNVGISGSASGMATGSLPAGTVAGYVLLASSTAGFAAGNVAFIGNAGGSGYYRIDSIATNVSFTITSIIPSASGTGAPNLTTSYTFSSGERQSLTSSNFPELLNTIASSLFTQVANWETKVNSQLAALNLNDDGRSAQKTQKDAAKVDNNAAKGTIDAWQALPATGVTGRSTSGSVAPILSRANLRLVYGAARITQIEVALGTTGANAIIQSGETFSSPDKTNVYYQRYKWLNARINRASGSFRRYYIALSSKNYTTQLAADNMAVAEGYDEFFVVKRITFIDTTPIVMLDNLVGISAGDTVKIVSETQPEIQRVVIRLLGTNQLQLDSLIPNTYITDDIARLFKELQ